MNKKPSWAVIRRLPRYFRHLTELEQMGEKKISSGSLAEKMGLTASQVRQDFSCFGGFGQQGYGYNVPELKRSLAEILKIDQTRAAVIIGAGNLGRALICNFNFAKYGLRLAAAFDVSATEIGGQLCGIPVLDAARLEEYLKDNPTDIGILTLPKEHVSETVDILAHGGIRGIWNFTSIELGLDGLDVPVENVHFSESLMILSYQL